MVWRVLRVSRVSNTFMQRKYFVHKHIGFGGFGEFQGLGVFE